MFIGTSPLLHHYIKYLRGYYLDKKVATADKWPPISGKIYIRLALVRNEMVSRGEADHFTRLTLEGHIDQILRVKEPINESDIFLPRDSTKFVLLEGAPGIGKSTFAWELCRQWALRNVDIFLVVLLRLRDARIQNAQTITDLLHHTKASVVNAVTDFVEDNEGEGLLLIMDGFDEFPSNLHNNSLISDIIRGWVLPNTTLLITSRPSARVQLQTLHSFDKHIEVVGFSNSQIMERAESFFEERSDMLTSFKKYYVLNPMVKAMMYNPLLCTLVLDVYRENFLSNRVVPHTQTQLYNDLTRTLLLRHGNSEPGVKLPRDIHRFPREIPLYKHLMNISYLALQGRISDTVIFNNLPEGCNNHLGLMNNVSTLYGRGEDITYSFLHLTFQEYMAALYVSQLPPTKQNKLYTQLKKFDVILTFVAGMTKLKHIQIERKHKMMVLRYKGNGEYEVKTDEVRIKTSHVRYFYEMQDVSRCEFLFGRTKGVIQCESPFDVYSVGYSIASCNNAWVVELPWGGYDPELIKTLANGIKSQKMHKGFLEELILGNNQIKSIGLEYFSLFPAHTLNSLKRLVIFGRKFNTLEFDYLAKTLSSLPNLVLLFVYLNPELPDSTVKFFEAVSTQRNIRDISVVGFPDHKQSIDALANAIKPNRRIQKLSVSVDSSAPPLRVIRKVVSKSCLQTVIISLSKPVSLIDIFDQTSLGSNLYELEISTTDYVKQHRFPILYGVCRALPISHSTIFFNPMDLNLLKSKDESESTTVIKALMRARNLRKLMLLIPLQYHEVRQIVRTLQQENCAIKLIGFSEKYHLHYFSLLERLTLHSRIEWWT